MKFLTLLFSVFLLHNAKAAVIASNNKSIDNDKKTHILVIGIAEKLGENFFKSAETKAKHILSIYPDDQIILFATSDEKDLVRSSFFKTIESSSSTLKESVLDNYLSNLKSISSIDIYAHSNAVEGVILDKSKIAGHTMDETAGIWNKIKNKLSPNSYVMIHGCNAAVKMAPELSKKLNVAVLGALTSTDFQKVYEKDIWSFDFDAKSKQLNLEDKRMRMKSDNGAYKGHWGDWSSGGFPTYKAFCGNLDQATCQLSAIEALINFPSKVPPQNLKNLEDFKINLFDFMCPFNDSKDIYNDCINHLNASLTDNFDQFYSPFKGVTLNCSFEKCDAHFKCSTLRITFNPGSCKLINDNDKKSDSFVNEFKFYIEAYKLKTNNGLLPLIN